MTTLDETYDLARLRAGDADAFACVVRQFGPSVFALAFRIVRNREDAEEVMQDVFIKAFQGLRHYRQESGLSTWLYRIAYNTAISKVRKKRFEWSSADESWWNRVPDDDDEPFARVAREAQYAELENALGRLDPDERGLVLFYYEKEMSVREIAEITSLSESNVKVRLHRIRKKLYVLMTRGDE